MGNYSTTYHVKPRAGMRTVSSTSWSAGQAVGLGLAFLFAHTDFALQAGVVEGQADGADNVCIGGIEEHGQGLLLEVRIDVHDAVPVAGVGLAQVDDVAVDEVAIALVPADDFLHHLTGFVGKCSN